MNDGTAKKPKTSTVHNYNIRCECDALYSDTSAACHACGKANPENAVADTQRAPASGGVK